MSEGIYESPDGVEGDAKNTNIVGKTYANVAYKPSPDRVVVQHSVYWPWWKRPSGVAAVCLGLLCVFLLAGIIGQSVYYGVIEGQSSTERHKLQTSYKNLTEERDQLKKERDNLLDEVISMKCPNGWKQFGYCSLYYVSSEQNNWEYANQDCLKRGAQLVIINNQEEQKFLISLNIRTWIGLSDRETEGTWRWVDDTHLTTAYWGATQPDNGGDIYGEEDCAESVIWYREHVNKWNDSPCTLRLNWICEKVID